MKLKGFLVVALFSYLLFSQEEHYIVKGKVIYDNQPVEYAKVTIQVCGIQFDRRSVWVVFTDENGDFSINSVAKDVCIFFIEHPNNPNLSIGYEIPALKEDYDMGSIILTDPQENSSTESVEGDDMQFSDANLVLKQNKYELKGVILYEGKPVINTEVYLSVGPKRTFTDENGKFYLFNVPGGKNELNIYPNHENFDIIIHGNTCVIPIRLNKKVSEEYHVLEITELNCETIVDVFEKVIIEEHPFPLTLDPIHLTARPPFTAQNISGKELKKRALGQDLPILLKNTPALIATSDAGAGIGYTGMRIRGSDQTRINVTLNGVPVNDSESQNVFWVNMPDLSNSVNQVIIQRGLGTSTNGTGAFGASVNIETTKPANQSFLETEFAAGSFGTTKYAIQGSSGKFAKNWSVEGCLSHINSDGYIDRATSDLWSYGITAKYEKNHQKIWFTTFGGKEKTYQAWYGVDQQTLKTDRTFNFAGAILDDNGNIIDFHDNQVDDYHQDHYQLHYEDHWNGWDFSSALHYTYGRGFFEEYRNDEDLQDYKLPPGNANLVRRLWLKNDFYGGIFNLKKDFSNLKLLWGGAINRYDGDHFGRVIWVENQPHLQETEVYRNNGLKDEISSYIKGVFDVGNWEIFADFQWRNIQYRTSAKPEELSNIEDYKAVDERFNFFNPKAGFTYASNFGDFYLSYALGHREPNRSDFIDHDETPKAEVLHDVELGFRTKDFQNFSLQANAYYMYYENQLVLTGEVNNVGAFIRTNSGKSYRAGLEINSAYQFSKWLQLYGNVAYSMNRNQNWNEEINGEAIDFGATDIAFSPDWIANVGLEIAPIKGLTAHFIQKYVSEQYMSNANYKESLLNDYFISDVQIQYQLPKIMGIHNISFTLLLNNILDEAYENNGYYFNYFDGNTQDIRGLNHNPYYYPQAGFNFLAGIRIRF